MEEIWTNAAWLAKAHAWIEEGVRALGARRTEPIEQPHVRQWSTALRVPTSGGVLWFKANAPALAHEAGIVDLLARRRPEVVSELVAVDLTRGWMLMRDGGSRLREILAEERDLGRWLDILPPYAKLQLDLAADADELVALGAPDRRLATLPEQLEQLLAELGGLEAEEQRRLEAFARRVPAMCRGLEAIGIPETIQHDDLHDGQVFVRDGGYRFLDWGDSCISHPFFSMSVTLEGFLAWGLDDVEGSVDVSPFRDAYLAPFAAYAGRNELEAAYATAVRLGWVCRALNVRMFASSVDPASTIEWLARVRVLLRMAVSGTPTQPGSA